MQLMRLASAVEVELWKELMRLACAEVNLKCIEVTLCNCSIFDEMGGFELCNSQGSSATRESQSILPTEFAGKLQVRKESQ
jgi:hypothetical protein